MKFRPFLIVFGIWMFLGLTYSGQSFFYSLTVGRTFNIERSLFHSFTFCLEWALLTPFVLRFAALFRLDSKNFPRNIIIHFFAGLFFALLQQTIYVLIVDVVEGGFRLTKELYDYIPSIVGYFEFGIMMYWSVVFVYHAIGYYRQYQQEEKNSTELRSLLAESQLQALKMQLQPHFLFNTLNAISVLVKKEPSLAQKMIVRLSDLLRLTLERGGENKVLLGQELEFLNTYLAIEKVRFGDRLTVTMSIAEKSVGIPVPTLILQPLVENSIRHGIAQRSGNGWIEVNSELQDGKLVLSINDGGERPKRKKRSAEGTGVGLDNTRSRLRQLYGENFSFEMEENKTNGTNVRIVIPSQG